MGNLSHLMNYKTGNRTNSWQLTFLNKEGYNFLPRRVFSLPRTEGLEGNSPVHAHLGEILFEHSGAFFQINMHRDCTSRLQSNTELNMLKLIDFSAFKGTKLCAELWPNSCKNTYVISFSHYNSCTEFFF